MAEITRDAVARVGVDLPKRVFQAHAVAGSGGPVFAKPMAPDRFFAGCAALPAGCLVAMAACGGAGRLAESRGGAGQQERAHPVGRAHPRRHLRREPCSRGAGAALCLEPAAGILLRDSFPPADAKRR